MCISTESIYRFVYTSAVAAKLKLYSYLPSKRYKRQERGKRRQRIIIPQRISIHQRDAIATKKVEVGNFKADLTFHKGNQSMNIGALVDKKSQKIIWTEPEFKPYEKFTHLIRKTLFKQYFLTHGILHTKLCNMLTLWGNIIMPLLKPIETLVKRTILNLIKL